MTKNTVMLVALLLMLAAYPLASYGTSGNSPALVWATLGLLTLGGLIPPVLRFLGKEDDSQQNTDKENS
ncbi:hypothetical protein [Deinococcus peraridilitoris]|uniref:Uncharacterized protein n=1 Tax=Deinococcus peraridilitoris (strain DSM 19664 / LMG 22246 / CIP 109416 / KR-200) TaxID=937777 RepID=L0A0M3_DEIPD|nr:hypothetical protein [Deinococcus peraridilitoris]AFZ66555.1 hypothetical protein Deipe_0991 [Deinococcus peraridilitoris DSM 19664]